MVWLVLEKESVLELPYIPGTYPHDNEKTHETRKKKALKKMSNRPKYIVIVTYNDGVVSRAVLSFIVANKVIGELLCSRAGERFVNGANKHEKDTNSNAAEPHQTNTTDTIHNKGNGNEVSDGANDTVDGVD